MHGSNGTHRDGQGRTDANELRGDETRSALRSGRQAPRASASQEPHVADEPAGDSNSERSAPQARLRHGEVGLLLAGGEGELSRRLGSAPTHPLGLATSPARACLGARYRLPSPCSLASTHSRTLASPPSSSSSRPPRPARPPPPRAKASHCLRWCIQLVPCSLARVTVAQPAARLVARARVRRPPFPPPFHPPTRASKHSRSPAHHV